MLSSCSRPRGVRDDLLEETAIIELHGQVALVTGAARAIGRACAKLLAQVGARLGPIDILVANAGIYPPESGPAEDLSDEHWNRTLDVNLTGMWHCCRGVIPDMKQRRSGRIILISSTSALTGEPLGAGYAASKGGVISLGASFAPPWRAIWGLTESRWTACRRGGSTPT
jgi:NAD(P)-dependent dehydrogenase (short-subunit alcohol dehydrogenase family)